MELKPIVELGVAEAYEILNANGRAVGFPPLDAIENEDWGRDWLLSRFLEMSPEELLALGLKLDEEEEAQSG